MGTQKKSGAPSVVHPSQRDVLKKIAHGARTSCVTFCKMGGKRLTKPDDKKNIDPEEVGSMKMQRGRTSSEKSDTHNTWQMTYLMTCQEI